MLPPRLWYLFTGIWLLFLFFPLQELFQRHHSRAHLLLVAIGLTVLLVGYLGLMRRPLQASDQSTRGTLPPLATLVLLGLDLVLLTLLDGVDWLWFVLYASIAAGAALPSGTAVASIAALTGLEFAVGTFSAGWLVAARIALPVAAVGLSLVGSQRLLSMIAELRAARQELARLAVADERLRFARDLHDLLGQSLSTITLKTEVARRLLRADPDRAEREIAEVLDVARRSLQEVRIAVSGYRLPTLQSELANARALLEAAGIALDCKDIDECLVPDIEAALAWTIREGATNVARHSRASRCGIRIYRRSAQLLVEVRNDGIGYLGDMRSQNGGHGLQGLAERVSAVGGSLTAGPTPDGGYCLQVSLPLDPRGTGQ